MGVKRPCQAGHGCSRTKGKDLQPCGIDAKTFRSKIILLDGLKCPSQRRTLQSVNENHRECQHGAYIDKRCRLRNATEAVGRPEIVAVQKEHPDNFPETQGKYHKIEPAQPQSRPAYKRTGQTRQTVAKALGKWRRSGWLITGRGRIMLLNYNALAGEEFEESN